MTNVILLYIGAILPIFWGVSHLFPTKSVVDSFGEISEDNKRILTMEWINESIALIFVSILVIVTTLIGESSTLTSQLVYWLSAVMLIAMALLALMTGARTTQLPFKLCPIIFGSAAVLILLGSFL
jgi:hypothetical protein